MRHHRLPSPPAMVPAEVSEVRAIADAVSNVSRGVALMRSGRLNDKALVLLIAHASGQSQTIVKAVIEGMTSLEKLFFKKPGQR